MIERNSRTIRNHVACGNRDFGILNTGANAHRALVDVLVNVSDLFTSGVRIRHYQEGANAVASSVEKVKTVLPQVLAGQDIDGEAARALGKDRSVDTNKALENQGERPLLELGGLTEVESAGSVSSSIKVLAAGVTEVDSSGVDDGAAALLRFVMDHGTVRAGRRNGIKRQTGEEIVFGTYLLQLVGTINFIHDSFFVDELILEPCKVFGERGTITDVTIAHALQLSFVLDRLGVGNGASGLFGAFLTTQVQAESPRGFVRQEKLGGSCVRSLVTSRAQSLCISEDRVIWLDDHIVSKLSLHLRSEFLVVDVELCGGGGDDGVGEEHRVVRDTDYGQPFPLKTSGTRYPYSLPRKLNSHAISSSMASKGC